MKRYIKSAQGSAISFNYHGMTYYVQSIHLGTDIIAKWWNYDKRGLGSNHGVIKVVNDFDRLLDENPYLDMTKYMIVEANTEKLDVDLQNRLKHKAAELLSVY